MQPLPEREFYLFLIAQICAIFGMAVGSLFYFSDFLDYRMKSYPICGHRVFLSLDFPYKKDIVKS